MYILLNMVCEKKTMGLSKPSECCLSLEIMKHLIIVTNSF